MKILVTGSNGYVGQHLVKHLQLVGNYVVGLDRVDHGVNIGDEFIHQDILDTNQIEGEYDTVIHLAALVQVGGGQKAMMDYYRTNIVGTMNILERVEYKNFVFASTCQAGLGTVYGESKYIGELTVEQYCQLNNKDFTVFQFGNVAGTNGFEPTNTDGLLYNLMKAKETGKFYLYGNDYTDTTDGTAERDYIHVTEVCYALDVATDRPANTIKYIGHGKHYSVLECIEAFKKANNCDFEVVVMPRREGDPSHTFASFVAKEYLPPDFKSLEEMMKI